jgi:hypothetical protein
MRATARCCAQLPAVAVAGIPRTQPGRGGAGAGPGRRQRAAARSTNLTTPTHSPSSTRGPLMGQVRYRATTPHHHADHRPRHLRHRPRPPLQAGPGAIRPGPRPPARVGSRLRHRTQRSTIQHHACNVKHRIFWLRVSNPVPRRGPGPASATAPGRRCGPGPAPPRARPSPGHGAGRANCASLPHVWGRRAGGPAGRRAAPDRLVSWASAWRPPNGPRTGRLLWRLLGTAPQGRTASGQESWNEPGRPPSMPRQPRPAGPPRPASASARAALPAPLRASLGRGPFESGAGRRAGRRPGGRSRTLPPTARRALPNSPSYGPARGGCPPHGRPAGLLRGRAAAGLGHVRAGPGPKSGGRAAAPPPAPDDKKHLIFFSNIYDIMSGQNKSFVGYALRSVVTEPN